MAQSTPPSDDDPTRTDRQPRTPTVGDDPRDAKETADPPGKVWFRDLDEAVIEADRCIQCGSCVAACPSDSIGIDDLDGRPTLVKMCTGCSRCWDFCPRSGLRYERVNAEMAARRSEASADDAEAEDAGAETLDHDAVFSARATGDGLRAAGQDGGAVTALLAGLLEAGEIDGAVVARESEDAPLKGETQLATTAEELLAGAGSFYNQTMQLGRVDELVSEAVREGRLSGSPDLALVGTPCVVQGATALQTFGREGELAEVVLTVALFCTRSFEYDRLRSLLVERELDLEAVDRVDIADGTLFAYDDGGAELLREDVKAFDAAALSGCAECADFTGAAADVSAGNVASPDGETTLVVRSERGARAVDTAAERGALALDGLEETDALTSLADWNRRRAEATLERDLDPEGDLTIGYEEHRANYDGTDREPEPHNPARAYQYERWC